MKTGNRKGALFRNAIYSKKLIFKYSFQKHIALQVYGKCSQIIFQQLRKYVHSLKRASLRLPVKASVSIEASIAIPVFLFCFLEILSLLNYLTVYSGVLYALKNVGDSVSVYGCVYDTLTQEDEEINIGEKVISSLVFSEVYLDLQVQKQCSSGIYEQTVKGGTQGIHMLGSHMNEQEETVLLTANYVVEPVITFAGTQLYMNNRYYARLWTGYSAEGQTSEEYVYITENASVYHLTEDCTHLKLSITGVKYEELAKKRNSSGAKYQECSFCCEGESGQGTYYITSQGDCYHQDISCLGLKRTIYCVEKEEVKDLPVCSRCSQKKEKEAE